MSDKPKKTQCLQYSLLFIGIIFSQSAFAHSPIKGIGFLFNGILHPFFIPSHILLILTLGFWIGQQQPQKQIASVLLYLGAMITGLLLTAYYSQSYLLIKDNNTLILLSLTILIGLMTLSAVSFPSVFIRLVSIIVAFALGFDFQTEDLNGSAKIISLVGSAVGSYFMLLYAIALSETLSVKKWQKISIRILASWLSAGAIMVLALNVSH